MARPSAGIASSPTIRADFPPEGPGPGGTMQFESAPPAADPFGVPPATSTQKYGAPPAAAPRAERPTQPGLPEASAIPAAYAPPPPRAPAPAPPPAKAPAFEATVRSPVPQPTPYGAEPIPRPYPAEPVPAATPEPPPAVSSPSEPPAPTPTGISRPGKVTQMFFTQGDAVDRANRSAQLEATGEAHRKPGQTQMFMEAANLEQKLVRKSRAPLYLGIAAVCVVGLAVAAALVLPQYLGPTGSDRASVAADRQALALIRQDDTDSLTQADAALEAIVKAHPKYVDPQAHRAMVLEFRADAMQNQVHRLREAYEALDKEVAVLNKRKEPADWMQKVNGDIEHMKQMQGDYNKQAKDQEQLGNQAFAMAQSAYKADPGDAWATLALALYYGDHDDADKNALFVKKYEKLVGKKDGWAELARAELDSAPPMSAQKRTEGISHVTEALGRDPSLTRARYLRVAMDVGLKDGPAAKDDLAALLAANPKHEAGKQLVDYLEEVLARQRAAQADQAARAAEQAKPEAAATPASKKKAKKGRRR